MQPDFSLIGILIRYRSVIQFIAVVDIVSGVAAFLLDLLRLTKFTANVLPLVYSGIWIGLSWISTGCFALLASTQPSHYGQRLRKYVIGLLILGTLSLSVCCIVIIAISYFPPSLDNYLVYNHTNLHEIDLVPFLTTSNLSEVRGMVIIKSLMVILSAIKLFNACCELTFGVMQFRSGYFDFMEYWTKVPMQKVVRSRTFPHSARTIKELAKEDFVDAKGRTNLMRMKSVQPVTAAGSSQEKQRARKVMSVPI
ncbi:uncharacterized protein LOC129590023 [Paramacrobiotus metropolitanus]|uniref:uncharacterized protein LOC129590023 n=1 Tax=Paramacrobiotus metropolitanus TaxID=2943436 RepID=UPI0024461777|nr:uncharacterized protein LOC129590023 [Paramacrobiotus metropolitanus]